jgi:hypothetical protein
MKINKEQKKESEFPSALVHLQRELDRLQL